jgi:hypothetical protein
LEQRRLIPARPGDDLAPDAYLEDDPVRDKRIYLESFERDKLADRIILEVVREMPQLSSRLLVRNKDLYGKYDRHMAEAALRINVSIPLTVLLILATWLSGIPTSLQVILTLASLAFGFMLFRQGFMRTVSARDVIAQALSIDEVQSRHIPLKPGGSKEPKENRVETPHKS